MELVDIIYKCLQHDRQSQKRLYMMYADDLMVISMRYCKDFGEAKDVVQNAFVKIFAQLDKFDPDKGKLKSWMCKIVINEALQVLRKNKRLSTSQLEVIENKYSSRPDIYSQLNVEEIYKLIETLPPGYKFVFNMNVIEGLNHREIAEILGITESASRSQLTRAKKMLKELIIQNKIIGYAK